MTPKFLPCPSSETETLQSALEPAIDQLAEYLYLGFSPKLDNALEIAKGAIERFPDREEPRAMLTIVNLFRGKA
jgi:hypothetical protein